MAIDRRKFLASTGQSLVGGVVLSHYSKSGLFESTNASSAVNGKGRERTAFDADWRFHLGNVSGGERLDFDDRSWEQLDIPHDWSIAGPFREENPSGPHGAYLPGGIGWYRKAFTMPQLDQGRSVEIQFDGVYMNSEVWLNGHHLGRRPYGYVSFAYDLTPYLLFGNEMNVLSVKVDNSLQPNCRWYSGSGIYRHVWLTKAAKLRVDHWGTFVHARSVSADSAELNVSTRIRNERTSECSAVLVTRILDADGTLQCEARQAYSVPANTVDTFTQSLQLANPRLWSPDEPVLYMAVTQIIEDQSLIDEYRTPFGVRSATFDADRGFSLNGQPVLLKGVCIHHDLGALGAAFHEAAMERRLHLLKNMGCNAIRMSHNPPAPQLLDMCDRMGFLVIDEAFDGWRVAKNGITYGYHLYFDEWAAKDLTSMIERDRNHPSIILWSTGNEVPEKGKPEGVATARKLVDIVHRLDPSRPATCAINAIESANHSGFSDVFDAVGYNGGGGSSFEYDADHARYPHRKIYGSEAPHTAQTRSTYVSDENYCSSYDSCFIRMNCEGAWKLLREHPFVAGAFRWAGIDYLGEPIPHKNFHTAYREKPWPARSGDFGVIDTCGFEKDIYYFYQSQWTSKPMLHILPHWNWEGMEGKPIFVWCYTNCDSVELFLNDRSLGVQHTMTTAGYHLTWEVPWAPGVLRAVGKRERAIACTAEVRTAAVPARIVLAAESEALRADGKDLAHIVATVTDSSGTMVPGADLRIDFDVQGAGRIIGVDNGDPLSHMDFRGHEMAAFRGKCLAVIQATKQAGHVTIRARAQGLQEAVLVLPSTVDQ
ncbi:MAG: glycoside hydrolase family 2 TIM barrel-domain containing protein [Acidobacteriota bacterium]